MSGRTCALLAIVGVALASPVHASAAWDERWIATGMSVRLLSEADPSAAASVFDQPFAYVMGSEDGRQNQVPPGWSAVPTLKYESYERFSADVADGRISAEVRSVVYNPENWEATPLPERQNPFYAMRRFYALAKSRGYHVQQAPSRDLMQVPGAVCGKRSGETLSAAYLRCNVAGRAARVADLLHLQAQVLERDAAQYRHFVSRNRERALAANPSVVFTSNLATSPYDYVATPAMLHAAWASVAELTDGHHLSMNRSELGIAAEFLGMLPADAAAPKG